MYITSTSILGNTFASNIGKHAPDDDKVDGVPTRSPALAWHDLPEGTVSLALVMQDYDAIPVCGFSWIHWLVANISPELGELPENASRTMSELFQGTNSLASKQVCGEMPSLLTQFYSGPRTPDGDHEYEITLFALDTKLDLQPGFRLNELRKKMRGHILSEPTLRGIYTK